MAQKYVRHLVLGFEDTHGGAALGLINPETPILHEIRTANGETLFETRPAQLNPSQETLYNLYEGHIKEVEKLAGPDPIYAIHNGDLSQGNKYFDDIAYASVANQITIAQHNMHPILRLKTIKSLRLMWGTDSHIFQGGSTPQLVAQGLSSRFTSKDIRSLPHGLFNVAGVWHDVAHHGPTVGSRDWLIGNEMRYYMRNILRGQHRSGMTMPHVIMRGHYHTAHEEWMIESYDGIGRHKCVFILGPSYTFMNEYARKVTKSNPQGTVGMYAIEIINGKVLDVHWFKKSFDLRIKEKLA